MEIVCKGEKEMWRWRWSLKARKKRPHTCMHIVMMAFSFIIQYWFSIAMHLTHEIKYYKGIDNARVHYEYRVNEAIHYTPAYKIFTLMLLCFHASHT